jgi:hypothetical protein
VGADFVVTDFVIREHEENGVLPNKLTAKS